MKKPTLKQIKNVIQYLDEEMNLEGSWDDVCEFVAHLKEDEYSQFYTEGVQCRSPETISVSNITTDH